MLPLLVLTLVTMGLMALVAITFGQAVVRRQQAQIVVDAAAFAGAAEQAKGLNTIARINEKQLNIINGIVMAQGVGMAGGYRDNYDTTMARLTCGPACGDDWSSINWFDYEKTFEHFNSAARAVNHTYGTYGKPYLAARRVIEKNYESPDGIFAGESPVSHGPVVWVGESLNAARLARLTEPKEYAVGDGRHYTPDSAALDTWCTIACAATTIGFPLCYKGCKSGQQTHYLIINAALSLKALDEVPEYRAGQFYDNEPGADTRFSYYLRLPGPKPLTGKSWFGDVPDMVVVATAKPYGGHLGDEFEENFPYFGSRLLHFGYGQNDDKKVSWTYKARLIPVRTLEKRQLAIQMEGADVLFDPELLGRYMSVSH